MDIKALAQAAGFDVHPRKGDIRSPHDFAAVNITDVVEKFARLVADAEREACAQICDDYSERETFMAANEIRARSNAKVSGARDD